MQIEHSGKGRRGMVQIQSPITYRICAAMEFILATRGMSDKVACLISNVQFTARLFVAFWLLGCMTVVIKPRHMILYVMVGIHILQLDELRSKWVGAGPSSRDHRAVSYVDI